MATEPGGVKKAVVKKAAAKKAAPLKKTAAKKSAASKTTAAKKTAAPTKAPATKATPTKKAAPGKKTAPTKKPVPAKRAAPLKAAARPAAILTPPTVVKPTVTTPPTGEPLVRAPEAPNGEVVRDDHIVVGFAGPATQRRWTVAFRIILAIPHFLWLSLLGIAVFAVTVVGWFAALFTGRVPDGIARFIAQYLRYQTRVTGYGYYLLTDQYPPFALDADDYPISMESQPGPLNRWAVFFRLILLIPASFLAYLLQTGAAVVAIVGWIMTLITGRLPTALHQANAAALAYQTRTYAFACMITAEYPSGVYGEKEGAAPPLWDPAGLDEAPALPPTPRITRLVLAKAARRLVTLFIVLGAIFGIGGQIAVAALGATTNEAFEQLEDSRADLFRDLRVFNGDVQDCAINRGGIECIHAADVRLAAAFDEFADEVETIDFLLSEDRPALVEASRQAASDLRAASRSDGQAYVDAVNAFQRDLQEFDEAYFDLTNGRN